MKLVINILWLLCWPTYVFIGVVLGFIGGVVFGIIYCPIFGGVMAHFYWDKSRKQKQPKQKPGLYKWIGGHEFILAENGEWVPVNQEPWQ